MFRPRKAESYGNSSDLSIDGISVLVPGVKLASPRLVPDLKELLKEAAKDQAVDSLDGLSKKN